MNIALTLKFREPELRVADPDTVKEVQRIGTEVIKLGGSVNVDLNNDGGTTPARLTTEKTFNDWMDGFHKR